MSSGEQTPVPSPAVAWRDFERHERRTDDEHRSIRLDLKDVTLRVDRLESVIDQMKGIRALVVTVFGTSVVTALIGVITLVALINGNP